MGGARVADAARALAARLGRLPEWAAVLAAFGWYALLWRLSSGPAPSTGGGLFGDWLANFLHAVAYGFLALLCLLALPRRRGAWVVGARAALAVAAACAVLGFVDEWHQHHVPGRDASLPDLLTDATGALGTGWCVRAALAGAPLVPRIFASLVACAACASLATFLPRWLPDAWWL
jgi:VanZ family protein